MARNRPKCYSSSAFIRWVCLHVCLSMYMFILLPIHLSVRPFVYSSIHPSICLSVCLTVWNKHLLEKLVVPQHVNKLPAFYKPADLLPRSLNLIVPILEYINRVQAIQEYFIFNLILPSTSTSSKFSLSFRFPHHNTERISAFLHSCCISSPFHSSRFDQTDIDWSKIVFLWSHSSGLSNIMYWW